MLVAKENVRLEARSAATARYMCWSHTDMPQRAEGPQPHGL